MLEFQTQTEFDEVIKVIFHSIQDIQKPPELDEPHIELHILDDFRQITLLQASDEETEEIEKYGLPDFDGRVLFPRDEKKLTVLLNSRIFKDNHFVRVVIHEFVHVFDWLQFFNDFGPIEYAYRDEATFYRYYVFSLWSEFHAKRIGLIGYSEIVKAIFYQKEYERGERFDVQIESLAERLSAIIGHTLDQHLFQPSCGYFFWESIRELFTYYGRISVTNGFVPRHDNLRVMRHVTLRVLSGIEVGENFIDRVKRGASPDFPRKKVRRCPRKNNLSRILSH